VLLGYLWVDRCYPFLRTSSFYSFAECNRFDRLTLSKSKPTLLPTFSHRATGATL